MIVKPDPPPWVEVGRNGFAAVAASTLSQLFATQRLPGDIQHCGSLGSCDKLARDVRTISMSP
jgi:hypothetical protein